MKILISNKSKRPIYEQLENQLRDNILNGALKADEKLPSIRQLAKDLGISVITVKRSYDDLESEGFIQTISGKGSYVTGQSIERLREKELSQLEQNLGKIIDQAQKMEVDSASFMDMVRLLWEEGI